ncbi:MAG: proline--tRNA ligase [Treponema bryantii]|nr:proline--tRNA ligase [Treponema bryantii]
MKASKTIISTLREAPNDAVIASHQLMMRAGLIRKLGNGLYSYMPLGLKAFRKVENIIRQELDNAGMNEMKPTVIQPAEIWKESGRWEKMGAEMLKPQNRGGQDMVVSPTAEEAFTALVRDGLSSYKQLPFTLYQINTKYRDEIRPRYGVMRGREFTMMDAYSFDKDQADLDASYENAANAYRRIFKRMGLTTISVKADTGAMGGSGSEEFMVESEVGDDTLILCPNCKYAANVEKAACKDDVAVDSNGKPQVATDKAVEEIPTPDVKTIEELSEFLKTTAQSFIKTLIYKVENAGVDLGKNNDFVAVCIRGDLDVNEAKLCALLKASDVELASEADVVRITDAPVGFAGPIKLTKAPVIADNSVMTMHDCVTGGLKKDVHFIHVEPGRDFTPMMTADVRVVKPGDICPECGGTFYSKKGNELGHIFKLGDKYTKSMNVTYLDENGKSVTPIMGCYGIGVDRTLASIIEAHHDENGIIWTMSTAPYQVAIVPVMYKEKMKEVADSLYEELKALGVDVLLDDRDERPGVKFKDADLIGYPIRIVVGDKNLPNVEVKLRSADKADLIPATDAAKAVAKIVADELAKLNS